MGVQKRGLDPRKPERIREPRCFESCVDRERANARINVRVGCFALSLRSRAIGRSQRSACGSPELRSADVRRVFLLRLVNIAANPAAKNLLCSSNSLLTRSRWTSTSRSSPSQEGHRAIAGIRCSRRSAAIINEPHVRAFHRATASSRQCRRCRRARYRDPHICQ